MQLSNNLSKDQSSVLELLTGISLAVFYIAFTLLPNSNSLMVKWPWVLWWQIGLAIGPIAVIIQIWRKKAIGLLGNKLDWLTGGWILCLGINVSLAEFKNQAGWYAWAAVCAIAILYTLTNWMTDSSKVRQVLHGKGLLAVSFSTLSLYLWTTQTALPHLKVLEELKTHGIVRNFDWQIISLRNWYPTGHQNYVAGFLLLSLPLLLSFALIHKGKLRIFWCVGFVLSLICLYTTASRGSWFGLVASITTFLGLSAWQYPKTRAVISKVFLACTSGLIIWGLSNDRLNTLLLSIFSGQDNTEVAYRIATNITGWLMGLDNIFFGAGLGSVTLLYQKYRPYWADSSATLTYQLHSTPAQIWAELGLSGFLLVLLSLYFLSHLGFKWFSNAIYNRESFLLVTSLWSGLIGYSVFSLTDYQLDNICISGTLIIFFSTLTFHFKQSLLAQPLKTTHTQHRLLTVVGLSLIVIVTAWLYPIHRAWQLSSQGFFALQSRDIAGFVSKLERAHQLAPWEPYYSYQLGWNLGEVAYQTQNPQQRQEMQGQGSQWLKMAIKTSPYREFGYSNLGWLLVNTQPEEAVTYFAHAAELTSNKKGVFFALGYSLLKSNQPSLAVQAMVLELLRNPSMITSPIWQLDDLNSIHGQILAELELSCTHFINEGSTETLISYFHQVRGALRWWSGDFTAAEKDLNNSPNTLNTLIVDLAQKRLPLKMESQALSPAKEAVTAWLSQDHQDKAFYKALLLSGTSEYLPQEKYLSELRNEIIDSMEKADSFHHWVTKTAPQQQQRNQRLGFGVLSRHIDGPIPSDFSPRLENVLISHFFQELFPTDVYNPALDHLLEPLQTSLIHQLPET